jgi:15-cis-phytoene synthase
LLAPAPETLADSAADLAACRAKLAQGSRTFLAASRILPRRVREPACALYAFCRMADDVVDGQPDPAPAVEQLRQRLAAIYAGRPGPELEDRAMAAVVHRHGIPQAWPEALIEGFAWDAEGRRYETLHEVQAYAARVAGSVGAMMAALMGVRSPSALARACDLGVAMQLSNIARDVGEDAAMGRLYLPRQWMREAGLDPDAWLAQPAFNPALARVVQRLLDAAEALYARVGEGVAELPLACRPGINAARLLYREIGLEVQRRRLDSVNGRAVVSPARKVVGVLQALALLWPTRAVQAVPPLPANAYLVQALSDAGLAVPASPPQGWWHVRTQVLRTLAIIERLEWHERERAPWGAGPAL